MAEAARAFGDGRCGLTANGFGAVKAKELTSGCAGGFDYAVGDEGAVLVVLKLKDGFGVLNIWSEAEGKVGVGGDFCAVEVGVGMGGVGDG